MSNGNDFVYVSLVTGDVVGHGSNTDEGVKWQEKGDGECLMELIGNTLKRVSLPNLPFLCGNFLEHL